MMTRRTSGSAQRPRLRNGTGRFGIGLAALAVVTGGVGVWAAAADPADPNVGVEADEPNAMEPAAGVEKPERWTGRSPADDSGKTMSTLPVGSASTVQPTLQDVEEDLDASLSVSAAPASDAEVVSAIEAAFDVTVGGELMSDPELQETVEIDLPSVATGPIRAELEAELLEVQSHGWTREGSPAFSEIEMIDDLSVKGKRLVVSACVDWSAVAYTELDGSPIPANPTPRARNIFTLVPSDGGHWVIYDREFPKDPQC